MIVRKTVGMSYARLFKERHVSVTIELEFDGSDGVRLCSRTDGIAFWSIEYGLNNYLHEIILLCLVN